MAEGDYIAAIARDCRARVNSIIISSARYHAPDSWPPSLPRLLPFFHPGELLLPFHARCYFYFRPLFRRFSGNGICALGAIASKPWHAMDLRKWSCTTLNGMGFLVWHYASTPGAAESDALASHLACSRLSPSVLLLSSF